MENAGKKCEEQGKIRGETAKEKGIIRVDKFFAWNADHTEPVWFSTKYKNYFLLFYTLDNMRVRGRTNIELRGEISGFSAFQK